MSKITEADLKKLDEIQEHFKDADEPTALNEWLRPWVEFKDDSSLGKFFFRHPLYYSVIGPLLPHVINRGVSHKFEVFKELWREKKWHSLLFLIERPYRLHYLRRFYERGTISHAEMSELLVDWWMDTEIPEGQQEDPLWLFEEAGFVTDDPEGFEKLPDEITLYRGVDGVCELTPHGPSWTTSEKVARWFGNRYAEGKTYTITIQKSEALAWLTGRDETEIILNLEAGDERIRELA